MYTLTGWSSVKSPVLECSPFLAVHTNQPATIVTSLLRGRQYRREGERGFYPPLLGLSLSTWPSPYRAVAVGVEGASWASISPYPTFRGLASEQATLLPAGPAAFLGLRVYGWPALCASACVLAVRSPSIAPALRAAYCILAPQWLAFSCGTIPRTINLGLALGTEGGIGTRPVPGRGPGSCLVCY